MNRLTGSLVRGSGLILAMLLFTAVQLKAETVFKTGFETGEPALVQTSGLETVSLPGGGTALSAPIRKDGTLLSIGIFPQELAAGWYTLEARYKTEGFTPMGGFFLDERPATGTGAFDSDSVPAASDWSQIKTCFYVPANGKVGIGLYSAREAAADGRVLLDDLSISPLSLESGKNLLGNPDFAVGKTGELPADWNWDYHNEENYKSARGADGDYALVADKTFRTGKQVLRVILTPDQMRELKSFNVPLPQTGNLACSIWAKGEGENLSIRLSVIGAGYKYHIYKSFVLTGDWREYRLEGPCKDMGAGKQCWVRVDFTGPGKFYLADASLVWTENSAAASVKATDSGWWGAVGRNLLLNPGFELGWTGWMLDYFENTTINTRLTDQPYAVVEKDGNPNDHALSLPTSCHLSSTSFPIERGKKYTLSADLKSAGAPGSLYMIVHDPGWNMYSLKIDNLPTDKWTRYTLTFTWDKPDKAGRAMAVFNNVTDTPVLVDNVQFEEGEPTGYTPPPVMIGMMPPEGSGNLFFYKKDAPRLTLKVLPSPAAPETVKVRLTDRDAWGNIVLQKDLAVSGREVSETPVEFPADKLGVFEVRLQALGADGKLLGLGISRYAIIDTPAAQALGPDSLFGVGYNIPRWTFPAIKEDTVWMRKLGVGVNRFFLNNECYPIVVKYDEMERNRRQMAIQQEAGIKLIGIIGIPDVLRDQIVYTDNPTQETLDLYREHVRTFVAAFKDQIRCWEVLNEPNIWRYPSWPNRFGYQSGSRVGEVAMPPAKDFALQKIIYQEVKKIDPKMTVVGGCIDYFDPVYLKGLLDLGAAKYMDVLSFHGYRASPDLPEMYADIERGKALLKQYGFTGPIIDDEQMFLSNNFAFRTANEPATAGVDYILPGSQEFLVAAYNMRSFIQCATEGVPLCLYDPDYILARKGATGDLFMFYTFGAYNAATRFLSDAGPGEKVKTGEKMRAFLFPQATAGPLLAVYTPETGLSGHLLLAGDFTAYDIMGNQLTATDLKDGVPLRNDPTYIRFKKGTTASTVKNALATAETTGMGNPLSVEISFGGPRTITVSLTNKESAPLSGTVALAGFPEGWVPVKSEAAFNALNPQETVHLDFDFSRLPAVALGRYPVSVRVNAGKSWATSEKTITPLFARYMKSVTVDGNLNEWQDADWVDLGENNLSTNFNPALPHKGPADLSARVACGWNEGFFALAVKVEDDAYDPPEAAGMAFANDSLQVYFDPLKNARPGAGFDSDDIVYSVSSVNGTPTAYLEKGTAGHYVGEQNQMQGIDRDVQVAVKRTGTTTVYEVKFPAGTLPNVKLAENASFGFSLLINDNDGQGRKQGLTFSPRGTEPYKNPYDYPDISLVK